MYDPGYWENKHERDIQNEFERLGIKNDPCPEVCPGCKGELSSGGGMAGETVLYCTNDDCDRSIVWEDSEGAIRNVY